MENLSTDFILGFVGLVSGFLAFGFAQASAGILKKIFWAFTPDKVYGRAVEMMGIITYLAAFGFFVSLDYFLVRILFWLFRTMGWLQGWVNTNTDRHFVVTMGVVLVFVVAVTQVMNVRQVIKNRKHNNKNTPKGNN